MNTIRTFRTLAALGCSLSLFALVGCGDDDSGGSASGGQQTETKTIGDIEGTSPLTLFPHEAGNQWVYESQGDGQEITFRIKDSQKTANGDVFTLALIRQDAKTKETTETLTKWRISEKGLYQISAGQGLAYEPALPVVTFPIKVGEESEYKGRGPVALTDKATNVSIKFRVRGVEAIDTPMGSMEAVAFESVGTYTATLTDNNGNAKAGRALDTMKLWFVPDVGIVRYVSQIRSEHGINSVQTLKLKSYTGKK